jgi:polyisoprenoid-binding protein YceI
MQQKTKWSIDQSQSKIIFKVDGLIFSSVEGRFKTFDAEILTSDKDFKTVEITLWIDGSTITTGDKFRDDHLKSSDFFDTLNHKQIIFKSNKISEINSEGYHELTGDLTIKQSTHNVKLNVKFNEVLKDRWGNEITRFTIDGKIHRQDYGLTWNAGIETGGLIVSEVATISCELLLTKAGQNIPNMN